MFLENRGEAFGVWREPFVELRVPLLFNLRRDPFERAQHNSNTYNDWFLDRVFVIVLAGHGCEISEDNAGLPAQAVSGVFASRQDRRAIEEGGRLSLNDTAPGLGR